MKGQQNEYAYCNTLYVSTKAVLSIRVHVRTARVASAVGQRAM